MKKSVKGVWVMVALMAIVSCKKDDVSNKDCQTCEGPNVSTSFEVCEEDGKLFVDGEEIPNENNITLEQLIKGLEDNITNDEQFEDLSCN